MTERSAAVVRALTPQDREAWETLYRGYRDFYAKPHDPTVFDTVWSWLMDDAHETRALLAEADGEPVALAHFRRFARPIDGAYALYLDDLFTSPDARGTGAGTALLHRLAEIARDEDAVLVRWITAADNETARRVYDREAVQTPWVTYDLKPVAAE